MTPNDKVLRKTSRKRQYLIQFSSLNTTNKWVPERQLRRASIAYFHKIGMIDDPKTNQILNVALDRRRYPQSHIVLPNEFGFNEHKFNSITEGSLYYHYQNPDTFYLKLLGDILCLLAKIQSNTKQMSPFAGILGGDYLFETSLNFKRIIKYADGQMLHHFMEETLRYYQGHRFLKFQFTQFINFFDEYNQLTVDKLFERERWERNFDHYLKHQIYNGQFDVDAYIYLIKELLKHYDPISYGTMQDFVMTMHKIGVTGLNVSEITNEIMHLTQNINVTLDDIESMHQIGDPELFYQRAHALQQLTTNKLIVFNSLEITTYLQYWMIQQHLTKDIHLFVDTTVMSNHFFSTIVIDTLNTCGLNVKVQLIFL